MSLPSTFDFETYINSYQGLTRIKRALFIADNCPSLEIEALTFAVDDIKQQTNDTSLYEESVKKLNTALSKRGNVNKQVLDTNWVEATKKKNKQTLEQLESELKLYKNSMVKESIRIAETKLGDYYTDIGKTSEATKHYSKTRDYCATSKNIMEMCFNMIKLHLSLQHYIHVHTYIVRAESTPQIPDKTNTLSRLKCCQAIAALFINDVTNRYQLAAQYLTQHVALESQHLLQDIMSPNDVAVYGGLCALATWNRNQLSDLMNNNVSFKGYLDLVPHIREIMESFQAAKYATCFTLMDHYLSEWNLDIHLSQHTNTLFMLIREKAMIQYCVPYSCVDMHRMATAFNTDVNHLETELARLIGQKNKVSARIDSHEKLLYSKCQDQRERAFQQSMDLGVQYEKSAKALMLRLNLLKADMIVH